MNKFFVKIGLSVFVSSLLVACGGGGTAVVATENGTFINSPTKGISYLSSPSGLTGTTDENGTYFYKPGDTVTFTLNLGASTFTLGSTSSPSAKTSILSLAVPNNGDPLAVAQILETLDKSPVDGKMDVSGISLSTGSTMTAISNALKSKNISSADIATIASGVQTALTSTNSGVLKYGNNGVSQNDALANLSKNIANQSLVETKIQNLAYDGTTTVIDVQDKTAFTNWIVKKGSVIETTSRFGRITSSGLTYSFKTILDKTRDSVAYGTYSLSNSNRNGTWVGSDLTSSGTFIMTSGDASSFAMTYTNTSSDETGAITGTYLKTLTLADIKGKSYTLYKACPNGTDNIVTISSSGTASDTCGSNVNGAVFSAGPYSNTLEFVEASGNRHYIGITRIDKQSGTGNLPSGAVGVFMNIYSTNSEKLTDSISFKVN
jgi:hypothetical protein